MNLEQLKSKLEDSKERIEKEILELQKITDFGSDVDSFEEESSESEQFGNQLAVAQDLRNQLADIETALRKIEKGTYGKCEKCGNAISDDVLEIIPESKLCKNCKSRSALN
ncbi:MAG: TraR/DksA C4-type zinc finger protein [Patescibacteria group bacterium]